MSQIRYIISNGNGAFILYETKNYGSVLVMNDKINLNYPVEIYKRHDDGSLEKIINIDVVDVFMRLLGVENGK
jgi:hypothetical protein